MLKCINVNGVEREFNFSSEAVFKANLVHEVLDCLHEPVFKDEPNYNLKPKDLDYVLSGSLTLDHLENLIDNLKYICKEDEKTIEEGMFNETRS